MNINDELIDRIVYNMNGIKQYFISNGYILVRNRKYRKYVKMFDVIVDLFNHKNVKYFISRLSNNDINDVVYLSSLNYYEHEYNGDYLIPEAFDLISILLSSFRNVDIDPEREDNFYADLIIFIIVDVHRGQKIDNIFMNVCNVNIDRIDRE